MQHRNAFAVGVGLLDRGHIVVTSIKYYFWALLNE